MQNNAHQRLAMILDALGENTEEVAHLLQYGGWHGLPHSGSHCPVALYLRAVLPDVTEATVSSGKATIHTTGGDRIRVELPPAVAGFVLAFDIGAYPLLLTTVTDDNGDVIDDPDL